MNIGKAIWNKNMFQCQILDENRNIISEYSDEKLSGDNFYKSCIPYFIKRYAGDDQPYQTFNEKDIERLFNQAIDVNYKTLFQTQSIAAMNMLITNYTRLINSNPNRINDKLLKEFHKKYSKDITLEEILGLYDNIGKIYDKLYNNGFIANSDDFGAYIFYRSIFAIFGSTTSVNEYNKSMYIHYHRFFKKKYNNPNITIDDIKDFFSKIIDIQNNIKYSNTEIILDLPQHCWPLFQANGIIDEMRDKTIHFIQNDTLTHIEGEGEMMQIINYFYDDFESAIISYVFYNYEAMTPFLQNYQFIANKF